MSAWIASQDPSADVKVEDLLNRYKGSIDSSNDGNKRNLPAMYNYAIKACVDSAKYHHSKRTKKDAKASVHRGIRLFTELLELGGEPDHSTFAHMFLLCGRMEDDAKNQRALLLKTMSECQKRGHLSSFSLGTFRRVAPAMVAQHALKVPQDKIPNLKVQDLPLEWRRNAPSK
mmetsp:Transcript_13788/g.23477  ORF Transcript_13788/g.23477 Transcript_13788/m.23477 type:complete len:173 (-) Transcript_13788:237-755(-)